MNPRRLEGETIVSRSATAGATSCSSTAVGVSVTGGSGGATGVAWTVAWLGPSMLPVARGCHRRDGKEQEHHVDLTVLLISAPRCASGQPALASAGHRSGDLVAELDELLDVLPIPVIPK